MFSATIKTFKSSPLATVIALIGTVAEKILDLIGAVCMYGAVYAKGYIFGLLIGGAAVLALAFLGALIRKIMWFIAGKIFQAKIKWTGRDSTALTAQ